ncbi:MAG: 50S ribosomal protein L5 [Deltaproteobacteria bacterium]|nr:MAG: 50S ribosomal protein L5 [Deltaproteobacteria bacterium]
MATDKKKTQAAGAKDSRKDRGSQDAAPAQEAAPGTTQLPRLQQLFRDEVTPALMKEFSYKNTMQVPRLKKITLNIGLGQAVGNPSLLKTAVEELSAIAGQRAVTTRAKKAIANFKLREGLGIGCMVTLRKRRMWEFLERLQSVAMPRIRDFKGMNGKGFDGRGDYNGGLREQTIFPEITYEKIDLVKGMNFSVVTTARTDEEGKALLKHLGMPFRN